MTKNQIRVSRPVLQEKWCAATIPADGRHRTVQPLELWLHRSAGEYDARQRRGSLATRKKRLASAGTATCQNSPACHLRPGSATGGPQASQKKKVVLFNDTFNTFNYPHVSIAATEVLEAAGFEVILPGHWCCGRPMISKGLVDKARAAAKDCIEKLSPFAEQGIPIVGLEPSCLLTLRDELLMLVPDDPRGPVIAKNAFLFEEFIAKLAEEGELDLKFKQAADKVLLHGHCQQKALAGTDTSKQTLGAAGCEVEEVDSGCCGMAGSFGYEAEHYDISQAMGERRLLPAVREAGEATTIVAAGVSCRQQIKHGTGRQALHPAEVLREKLVE